VNQVDPVAVELALSGCDVIERVMDARVVQLPTRHAHLHVDVRVSLRRTRVFDLEAGCGSLVVEGAEPTLAQVQLNGSLTAS